MKARHRLQETGIWTLLILLSYALSFLGVFRLGATVPNYLLALSLYAGMRYGPLRGVVLGLCCGFLQDALGGFMVGPSLLVGLYAGIFASMGLSERFPNKRIARLTQAVLVGLLASLALSLLTSLWPNPLGLHAPVLLSLKRALKAYVLGLPGLLLWLLVLPLIYGRKLSDLASMDADAQPFTLADLAQRRQAP